MSRKRKGGIIERLLEQSMDPCCIIKELFTIGQPWSNKKYLEWVVVAQDCLASNYPPMRTITYCFYQKTIVTNSDYNNNM